jgi:hypothetical protein
MREQLAHLLENHSMPRNAKHWEVQEKLAYRFRQKNDPMANEHYLYRDSPVYLLWCVQCEGAFYARHPGARFCSPDCHSKHATAERKRKRELARLKDCLYCGEHFVAKRKDGRFCSAKCKQAAHRLRHEESIDFSLWELERRRRESGPMKDWTRWSRVTDAERCQNVHRQEP